MATFRFSTFGLSIDSSLRYIFLIAISLLMMSCGSGSGSDSGGDNSAAVQISDLDNQPNSDGGTSEQDTSSNNNSTEITPAGFVPDPAQFNGDLVLNAQPLDISSAGFYSSHSATAILSGPVLGSGNFSDAEQSRSIPFQVGSSASGLVLEKVHAVRNEPPSVARRTNVIMTIRNTSDQLKCFVKVNYIQLLNNDNQLIRPDWGDSSFIAGASFSTFYKSTQETATFDTCLPAGERAYATEVFKTALDNVKGLSVESLTSTTPRGVNALTQSIVPLQYETKFGGEILSITLRNQSSQNIRVTGGEHIILNAEGVPLYSRFSTMSAGVGAGRPDGEFEPGQERIEDVIIGGFRGQANSVRSVFGFEVIE